MAKSMTYNVSVSQESFTHCSVPALLESHTQQFQSPMDEYPRYFSSFLENNVLNAPETRDMLFLKFFMEESLVRELVPLL